MRPPPDNLLAFFLLPCLLVLAGCGSTPSKALPEPEARLTNTYWRLASLSGEALSPPAIDMAPHLIFQDDGQVRGHTGCNVLKGAYGQVEGKVRFLAMGATRLACPDPAAEAALVSAMRDTRAITIQGRQLFFKGLNGETLAVFETLRQP